MIANTSLLLAGAVGATSAADRAKAFRPQWRGPLLSGVAPGAGTPVRWSETQSVTWKIEIAGHGSATPVICGDHLSVPTAMRARGARK
jgi:hypothetical protein